MKCQANLSDLTPCGAEAIDDTIYCAKHGATSVRQALEKKQANLYRIEKYRDRVNHYSEHDKANSLREEIAILRILLEELLNKYTTTDELLLQAGVVGELVCKINALVTSSHKIEVALGELMSKTKVLGMADQMVSVIADVIDNPETVAIISDKIMEIFTA